MPCISTIDAVLYEMYLFIEMRIHPLMSLHVNLYIYLYVACILSYMILTEKGKEGDNMWIFQ